MSCFAIYIIIFKCPISSSLAFVADCARQPPIMSAFGVCSAFPINPVLAARYEENYWRY